MIDRMKSWVDRIVNVFTGGGVLNEYEDVRRIAPVHILGVPAPKQTNSRLSHNPCPHPIEKVKLWMEKVISGSK